MAHAYQPGVRACLIRVSHYVLGTRAVGGQVMGLARVGVLECIGCLPNPVLVSGKRKEKKNPQNWEIDWWCGGQFAVSMKL
jgi:hypothetical protein